MFARSGDRGVASGVACGRPRDVGVLPSDVQSPRRSAALFRGEAQLQTLLACVGVSVALHSLALSILPGLRVLPSAGPTEVLTAFFASKSTPVAAPGENHAPKAQQPLPGVKPEEPSPMLAQDTPSPVEPEAVAPAPESGPPEEAARPQPAVSPHAPEPDATVVAERPLAEPMNAGEIEAYRLALIEAAMRYRRYPMQAMDRGWQGRVEVRLVIGANGAIRKAVIKTSSSYPILDNEALDMVRKGKTWARVPPALSGYEFTVDVPVIFRLQAA